MPMAQYEVREDVLELMPGRTRPEECRGCFALKNLRPLSGRKNRSGELDVLREQSNLLGESRAE
jgi:hypothetical protein